MTNGIVQSIIVPDDIKANTPFEITIKGYFPTAGWKLHKLDYSLNGNKIQLTIDYSRPPLGVSALTVIVNFTASVTISGLESGKYTIILGTHEKTINIE